MKYEFKYCANNKIDLLSFKNTIKMIFFPAKIISVFKINFYSMSEPKN